MLRSCFSCKRNIRFGGASCLNILLTRRCSTKSISSLLLQRCQNVSVIKLQTVAHDVDYTGHEVQLELADKSKSTGIVVLQRYPLVFVYGAFDVANDTTFSFSSINNCSIKSAISFSKNLDDAHLIGSDNEIGNLPAFGKCPDVAQIQPITQPLHVGITTIDVLAPLGRGQNMLFIDNTGSDYSNSTTAALFYTLLRNTSHRPRSTSLVSPLKWVYITENMQKRKELSATNDAIVLQISGDCADNTGVDHWLCANIACGVGNGYRSKCSDSAVVFDFDIKILDKFWNFSTDCLRRYVYGASDENGSNPNVYDVSADNSERRKYYASLFQQVGRLSDTLGGRSMTLLCGTRLDISEGGSNESASGGYSVDDFKAFPALSKHIPRVQLLASKGVKLTADVLTKLKIPLPPIAGSIKIGAVAPNFAVELTSLTDGQLVIEDKEAVEFNTTAHSPSIVPCKSLSRVGDNNKRRVDHDIPAIRDLTIKIRFDLSQVNDIMPTDHTAVSNQQRVRALAWLCAMEQQLCTDKDMTYFQTLSVRQQIILLYAVHSGLYDRFIHEEIAKVQLPNDSRKWSIIKRNLFKNKAVVNFNNSLVRICDEKMGKLEKNAWDCFGEDNSTLLDDSIKRRLHDAISEVLMNSNRTNAV